MTLLLIIVLPSVSFPSTLNFLSDLSLCIILILAINSKYNHTTNNCYKPWFFSSYSFNFFPLFFFVFFFACYTRCQFRDRAQNPFPRRAVFWIWQWTKLAQITLWRIIMRKAYKSRRSAQRRVLLSFWQLARFSWFNAPDTLGRSRSPMHSSTHWIVIRLFRGVLRTVSLELLRSDCDAMWCINEGMRYARWYEELEDLNEPFLNLILWMVVYFYSFYMIISTFAVWPSTMSSY